MKNNIFKKRVRVSREQRRVQNLLAHLRTLENQCSDEELAEVIMACRETQRRSKSK